MADTSLSKAQKGQGQNQFLTSTAMKRKFKINDGTSKYVEQSTLLEPANNATGLQHDQEEIKEVSSQLSQIKKKHDESKKLVLQKQEDLEVVKKEIEMVAAQETQVDGPVFTIQSQLEELQVALRDTKNKLDEEFLFKSSYLYMIDRLKKDLLAAKIKTAEMETSLKNKEHILETEGQKQRKCKEERLQCKTIFDNLMKNIEKEQKDRQERILELQKCIRNKEESVQRRIERQRRNQEIAEAAANENKDSSELKMRENLFIQKLWNSFMRKKMEKEMRNSSQIDDAFKSIKTATGVTDVQEMVKKFLTREQTYSQLLMAVSESERKIDKLKKDNEELRGRLHELQIDTTTSGQSTSAGEMDEDIIEMNNTLSSIQKDYSVLQEKFKKINIINDQVSSWAKKVLLKFGDLIEDGQNYQDADDLGKVFEGIKLIVCDQLQKLIDSQQDENDKGIEYGDVFTDFATDEFINKNIRVRPISGVTHGDETKDGRQSSVSKGQPNTDGNEEAEDNYNKFAILELEDQRKAIKVQHQQALEEIKRKQAQLQKDAEAKKGGK